VLAHRLKSSSHAAEEHQAPLTNGTLCSFECSAPGAKILSKFFISVTSETNREAPLKRKEIIAREQNGAAGALERCRELAEQIRAEVREKEPEGLDTNALAEFLVALQRAASVVGNLDPHCVAVPKSSSASLSLPERPDC
jgi:hypothetical protein